MRATVCWEPGATLRYEDPQGWAIVLVLEERSPEGTQRCLCLDGTRRYTRVGEVHHWNLGWSSELLVRIA